MNDEALNQDAAPVTEAPKEFLSVILTVDAVSNPTNPGPFVQKLVASDQTMTEATLSLIDYYGEEKLLSSPATIGQFQQAILSEFPAFIMRTNVNVEVILDASTFNRLCFEHGSVMQACKDILDLAGLAIQDTEKKAGGVVPLILMDFGDELIHGHVAQADQAEVRA